MGLKERLNKLRSCVCVRERERRTREGKAILNRSYDHDETFVSCSTTIKQDAKAVPSGSSSSSSNDSLRNQTAAGSWRKESSAELSYLYYISLQTHGESI